MQRVKLGAGDVALASEPVQVDGKIRLISLAQIVTTAGTQMRVKLNEATVADYAEAMTNYGGWGDFEPVVAFTEDPTALHGDYILADGFHRISAFERAFGRGQIPCRVRSGTAWDAKVFAAGANAKHGLPRTNEDKRNAVERMLLDSIGQTWSDRRIAEACAVSDRMVNMARARLLSTAKISQSDRRTGSDGRTINVAPISAGRVRYVPAHDDIPPIDDVPVRQVDAPSVMQSSAPTSRVTLPALGHCSVCGRPLSDPEHVANGCGPVCAAKKAGRFVAPEEPDKREWWGGAEVEYATSLLHQIAAHWPAMQRFSIDFSTTRDGKLTITLQMWDGQAVHSFDATHLDGCLRKAVQS